MKSFRITQSITNRQDTSLKLFFRDVSKLPIISQDEEIVLAKKAREGDTNSANKLVEGNLRFIISVAKQYQNNGLPLVDLIQIGCLGALEATKHFDETKGFKFISYAVWWIRQYLIKSISEQCRTVRVPMHQIVNVNKINKATKKFEQENERMPSAEELVDETNLIPEKINCALSSINRTMSLETPFTTDDAGCLLDIIPDNNSDDADENTVQFNMSRAIEYVLSKLTPRERDVIRMHYGLGMSPMQNEEIANRFGITSERIRQIHKEVLEKIKTRYSNALRELL